MDKVKIVKLIDPITVVVTDNGLPTGGTTNQVLAKIDATDYNTQWVDQSGLNIDGGLANSVYGGTTLIDSGGA